MVVKIWSWFYLIALRSDHSATVIHYFELFDSPPPIAWGRDCSTRFGPTRTKSDSLPPECCRSHHQLVGTTLCGSFQALTVTCFPWLHCYYSSFAINCCSVLLLFSEIIFFVCLDNKHIAWCTWKGKEERVYRHTKHKHEWGIRNVLMWIGNILLLVTFLRVLYGYISYVCVYVSLSLSLSVSLSLSLFLSLQWGGGGDGVVRFGRLWNYFQINFLQITQSFNIKP